MRLRFLLALLLVILSALPLVGCSRKAENLVGAGRLIRGPGGLGTTVRLVLTPDRDTYVEPGGTDSSSILFVGWQDAVEARSFFGVTTWDFPDTLPGFQVQSASLLIGHDLSFGSGTPSITLRETAWDPAAGWPGPTPGTLLGTRVDSMDTGEFSIPLNAGALGLISGWTQNPVTGFGLQVATGLGFTAYRSSTARFRIIYTYSGPTSTVQDTSFSTAAQGYFLRSPSASAPGSGTIVLGGFARTGLALRFPVDSIPATTSIDEVSVVLELLPTGATPSPSDSATVVEVRRIQSPWLESVTQKADLAVQDTLLTATGINRSYQSGSRRVVIRIPGWLLREWAATPSSNEGLYISLRDLLNHDREFQDYRIGSRESTAPPELHISYTDLPPVRF